MNIKSEDTLNQGNVSGDIRSSCTDQIFDKRERWRLFGPFKPSRCVSESAQISNCSSNCSRQDCKCKVSAQASASLTLTDYFHDQSRHNSISQFLGIGEIYFP